MKHLQGLVECVRSKSASDRLSYGASGLPGGIKSSGAPASLGALGRIREDGLQSVKGQVLFMFVRAQQELSQAF